MFAESHTLPVLGGAVQVERFACLYTSHVSNLSFYSPDKSFLRNSSKLACLGYIDAS